MRCTYAICALCQLARYAHTQLEWAFQSLCSQWIGLQAIALNGSPKFARSPRLAQLFAAQPVRLGVDVIFPWLSLYPTPVACPLCDLPERRLADALSASTGTLRLGSRACVQKEGRPGYRWAARAGLRWPVGRARSGGRRAGCQATPFGGWQFRRSCLGSCLSMKTHA